MDLLKDVINWPTIPTDLGEKFIYRLEWLVAAALTQTYRYIVKNGIAYSYFTIGEVYVFLYIIESELYTLYYHFTEPNAKAKVQDEVNILLYHTAIS
jgi:hypothetical protein